MTARVILMGQSRFRQGKIAERTTGKATDLISANTTNANADVYEEVRLAA
jgi:hypothetical protein